MAFLKNIFKKPNPTMSFDGEYEKVVDNSREIVFKNKQNPLFKIQVVFDPETLHFWFYVENIHQYYSANNIDFKAIFDNVIINGKSKKVTQPLYLQDVQKENMILFYTDTNETVFNEDYFKNHLEKIIINQKIEHHKSYFKGSTITTDEYDLSIDLHFVDSEQPVDGGKPKTVYKKSAMRKMIKGRERVIYVDSKRRQYVRMKGGFVPISTLK
jgi:hypothetical protein